jgi:hypothetical protein
MLRGASGARSLLSYVSLGRVCLCVYEGVHVCVYVCMLVPMGIIQLVRVWTLLFAYLICREKILRGWESTREMERERKFSC